MKYVCLFIFLLGAVGYDIDVRRIPNNWSLFWGLSGIFLSCRKYGLHGCLYGLLGILLPFFVLFVLFVWRVIGAGDIKMLSVIGTFLWLDVGWIMLYSFVLAAAYGFIVLIARMYRKRPFSWTRICMSIPITFGTILWIAGGWVL